MIGISRACLFGRYITGTARQNLLLLTICIDIPLTKPNVWDDRYRWTFHQAYCFGQIGIDRPFTTLLFRTIGIDRPFTILLFHILGIGTYTFRHYIVSVGQQRCSKTARPGTINSSSPSIIHAARPSPAQRRIPEFGAVCRCALEA